MSESARAVNDRSARRAPPQTRQTRLTLRNASRYGAAMRTATLLALLFVSASIARAGEAEDWPGWRGPRGDGTSRETNLPTTWSDTENVAWKVAVPGKGHSSPVVLGDKVLLTTALEDRQTRVLICLDRRNGNKLWETAVLSAPLEGKHEL